MFGGIIGPDYFYEERYIMHQDSLKAQTCYAEACRDFLEIFGRDYGLIEAYRTDDADLVVVTAGTLTSVTRIAIDSLREAGEKIGLMKVRMFRPVPVETWRQTLDGAAKVVVIDRNLSAGLGGVFASDAPRRHHYFGEGRGRQRSPEAEAETRAHGVGSPATRFRGAEQALGEKPGGQFRPAVLARLANRVLMLGPLLAGRAARLPDGSSHLHHQPGQAEQRHV